MHPITLHLMLPVHGIRRMLKAESSGWIEVAERDRAGTGGRMRRILLDKRSSKRHHAKGESMPYSSPWGSKRIPLEAKVGPDVNSSSNNKILQHFMFRIQSFQGEGHREQGCGSYPTSPKAKSHKFCRL